MWHTGSWSDCSESCGKGKQTRKVFCAKGGGKQADPKFCSKTKLPEDSQKCYGRLCGKVKLIVSLRTECLIITLYFTNIK